ncbi:hypothetical protein JG688_00011412 [Phytophthora aleatoria]|uniref:Uncharacterized protein n=1 Tax=Phytophthora aleatoria TaxID=2496075 RepID=A0A8J5IP60_9STRA|nr:hypothetical protein JG688_00011412 [Phytophthora aleatoria]
MAKPGPRKPARSSQATGRRLRERKPVDYIRSVQEFTRDPTSNEDYIDDSFATAEDVANEAADMESLEEEANDDGITKSGNDNATAAMGDKDATTGEKDMAIEPDATSRDATTLTTGAVNGDEDTFDGVDYIREFVHAAQTDAEQERTKWKDRPESLRGDSVPGEAAGDNEDGLPSKSTRTDLTSNVSSATAIKQQRARRCTKLFDAREQIIKTC